MALFKKKIEFPQFIADVMFNGFSIYDKNIDEWMPMADEFKVLKQEDKEGLKKLGKSLVAANVYFGSIFHFEGLVSPEDSEKVVAGLYGKYLREVKNLSEAEVEKEANSFGDLIEKSLDTDLKDIDGKKNQFQFALCSAFAKMYAGEKNLSDEIVRGKNFAAFKLAKNLVKADFMEIMLKEYKVNTEGKS